MNAAAADAHSTVLAERSYSAHVTARREGVHKKAIERQEIVHECEMVAKDEEIMKGKQLTVKECEVASHSKSKLKEVTEKSVMEISVIKSDHKAKVKLLQEKHSVEVSTMKIQYKARVLALTSKQMAVIDVKKRKIAQLRSDGGALLDILLEMPRIEKAAKDRSKSSADMRKLTERRLVMYHEYRYKFCKMKD